ncbi:hypothetical protein [Streptomyces capparidis]
MEAMDPAAIRAAMPHAPIPGAVAAGRIAGALGTPNQPGETAAVTVFVVRRLTNRGLLTDLSAIPEGMLLNPDQVDVCAREDLAAIVAAETPLGPNQAAARLAGPPSAARVSALFRIRPRTTLPVPCPR